MAMKYEETCALILYLLRLNRKYFYCGRFDLHSFDLWNFIFLLEKEGIIESAANDYTLTTLGINSKMLMIILNNLADRGYIASSGMGGFMITHMGEYYLNYLIKKFRPTWLENVERFFKKCVGLGYPAVRGLVVEEVKKEEKG